LYRAFTALPHARLPEVTTPSQVHGIVTKVDELARNWHDGCMAAERTGRQRVSAQGIYMAKVLVVDDEPTIRELVADALREYGYDVETASNGLEALHQLQRSVPRVIVLDLMMPVMDATGFVATLRLNPRYRRTRILVMTAAYGASTVAAELGADVLLTKPFRLEDLIDAVGQLSGDARLATPMLRGAHRASEEGLAAQA
jgi:CheY-like chemotaxis protein